MAASRETLIDYQPPHSKGNGAFRFACRVIPRSKRTCWGEPRAGLPTVRLAAPPLDGKANMALRRFLGTEFATAPSHVHIERGANSRTKTVRIDNAGRIPAEAADDAPERRLKASKPML